MKVSFTMWQQCLEKVDCVTEVPAEVIAEGDRAITRYIVEEDTNYEQVSIIVGKIQENFIGGIEDLEVLTAGVST
jgi:hypothetical protein